MTQSTFDRQNILNNTQTIENICHKIGITKLLNDNEYKFTTKMVANFYEIDIRSIKRCIES